MPRRAFTLIELLVVIAIIALLISILLPALAHARKSGRNLKCATQLKQLGVSTNSYAHEHKDFIWNWSWKVGDTRQSRFADLQTAGNDIDAQRNQWVDAFRRLTGFPMNRETATNAGLIPQILYSHFVLFDYLALRLPEPIYTCPEDTVRLNWAKDLQAFKAGLARPYPSAVGTPMPDNDRDMRWAFSSSYEVTISAYDGLQSSPMQTGPDVQHRMRNMADNHFFFHSLDTWRLRQQKLTSVVFPSMKVFLHEGHARHEKRHTYYATAGAKANLLFFDGSVSYRNNKDANRGWDPWAPASPNGYQYSYRPDAWEPRTVTGAATEPVFGFYRYTRGGLRGVDFGGREINTGQP
ncbi:MAG TPA: prepilin-type N-terminal cleavage/methylation domain-containing protein [Phycisphaerales bacterium]|nr:prepilin-type N-terminal cleavage/methylation domain-containing protein [Phycisphaerales bacterium]